ncbi:MAG: FMN-binding negative transcriptional regulator [Bacteroidia bacterium]|nr:FMN-binding negative transcriptional regulator [Bacteroidia bacterium]
MHDQTDVITFIKENPFGILVNNNNDEIWATHLPMMIIADKDGKLKLQGHVAKKNIAWKHFKHDPDVLAIFHGPHSYISSSWYEFEEVPTWNYLAVHVYGKIRILDSKELWDHLKSLTDTFEKGSKKPVKIEALSDKTMNQIGGIVGFEINVSKTHPVEKLSQGHSEETIKNVVKNLKETNNAQAKKIAEEMQRKNSSN